MGLRIRLLYDKGHQHPISITMKAFIFLCLVAAAMAEADPQFLYNSYSSYYPSTYAYGGAYSPYTYGYAHHYGKRDAEAEPQYVYSSGVHYPMTYGLHNYGYTHYPYTTAYSHIFKREAEAEPQYGYYGNYYSRPYGYSRTYGYSSYRPYSYSRFGYRGYW